MKKTQKAMSLDGLNFRKKYKVEKGFYKVKHHKNGYKLDSFKAEMIKDYNNYILMKKLKDGLMYCITKGMLIAGEKELVKLT